MNVTWTKRATARLRASIADPGVPTSTLNLSSSTLESERLMLSSGVVSSLLFGNQMRVPSQRRMIQACAAHKHTWSVGVAVAWQQVMEKCTDMYLVVSTCNLLVHTKAKYANTSHELVLADVCRM